MRSKIETDSESSNLKRKLYIRVLENNLIGLRELGQRLGPIQRGTFRKRYENILGLLEVKVQVPAVTALAQHYAPPMRCFTFRDFQLVLILEEYDQILDLPLEGRVPYKHLEQHVSIPTLAGIMKSHPRELEGRLVTRRGVRGFPKKYLETYLHQLADKEDWEIFMDVLALVIYGVLVFPNQEDLVDYDAIGVFIAVKTLAENPVSAILADTYTTLDLWHERRKRKMACCLSALYVWLVSRIAERAVGFRCPVELALKRGPELRGGDEWKQFFAGLNETKIQWQPLWQSRSHLAYSCGKYRNVPFMETKCCINYNPVLAQRQFGYPIKGAPTPASLIALLFYYEDRNVTEVLRQVRNAWKNVIYMYRDSRPWATDREVPYCRQWVAERVKEVKLPFKLDAPSSKNNEQMPDVESEEVKRLKEEIERLKGVNAKAVSDLQSLCHDYVDLKKDYEERTKAHEELMRKQKAERDYTFRIK